MNQDGGQMHQEEEQRSQIIKSNRPNPIDTSNWKFVTSNLAGEARSLVNKWIASIKCQGLTGQIQESVTHVIVSTGEDMQAQRTLKYLQGVASGKFIVSHLWVVAAMKSGGGGGNIPRPDDFEVLDEENGGENGPWRSRIARANGEKPILFGFEVVVSGDMEGLSKSNVEDLLSRAGARCLPDENAFSFSPSSTRLIIEDSTSTMNAKVVSRRLRSYQLATVEKDWLLDSLGGWSARPLLPYMLPGVTRQDLMTAKYSNNLAMEDQ